MNELTKQSYTMDEIARMINVTKGAVCNMAKRHGILHTSERKGKVRVSVYSREAADRLISVFGQNRRRSRGHCTTKELAERADVSLPSVRNVARRLGLKPKQIPMYPGGRISVYPENDARKILAYIADIKSKQKEEQKEEDPALCLNPDYPLVTDPRCFVLTWFPDPVPKCFKNMDIEGD